MGLIVRVLRDDPIAALNSEITSAAKAREVLPRVGR